MAKDLGSSAGEVEGLGSPCRSRVVVVVSQEVARNMALPMEGVVAEEAVPGSSLQEEGEAGSEERSRYLAVLSYENRAGIEAGSWSVRESSLDSVVAGASRRDSHYGTSPRETSMRTVTVDGTASGICSAIADSCGSCADLSWIETSSGPGSGSGSCLGSYVVPGFGFGFDFDFGFGNGASSSAGMLTIFAA